MSDPQVRLHLQLRPKADGIAKLQALDNALREKSVIAAAAVAAPITDPAPEQVVDGDRNGIGTRMKDGTIFAGISPTTHQPMYVAPADSPFAMDFSDASQYAKAFKLDALKDFRLPDQAELQVICDNRDKGALKGTFNETGSMTDGWYWSSDLKGLDYAYGRKFSDKTPSLALDMEDHSSVRLVRSMPLLLGA